MISKSFSEKNGRRIFQSISPATPLLRKEFLSGAVPVMLQGMGGPGAPHQFDINRREDLGNFACN